MTIQMKATEQYFPVVPFIVLHEVVLTFGSLNEIIEMYGTAYCFSVVMFIVLQCKTVFTQSSLWKKSRSVEE